jgi:asparagine synthase (glutamine-hydrolysing)
VEPRYPFFDSRLIDYCLALPSEQKLHAGWTRVVMRRAMEGVLPQEVQWRPSKSNLSDNFHRALLRHSREALEGLIIKRPDVLSGYADVDMLRRLYKRYTDQGETRHVLFIWHALILGLWLTRAGIIADGPSHTEQVR